MYDLGKNFKMREDDLKVDEKSIIKGKCIRIEVLTDRVIRFEYSDSGKFVNSCSSRIINRKFDVPKFVFKEDETFIYIETKYVNIKYKKSNKYTEKSLGGVIKYSKKEWFYTQKEVRNYGGTIVSLDNITKMPNLGRGLFNSEFYFVLDDSDSLLVDSYSNVQKREPNSKDFYLFAYGNDFNEVLDDYFHLTGYPSFI